MSEEKRPYTIDEQGRRVYYVDEETMRQVHHNIENAGEPTPKLVEALNRPSLKPRRTIQLSPGAAADIRHFNANPQPPNPKMLELLEDYNKLAEENPGW